MVFACVTSSKCGLGQRLGWQTFLRSIFGIRVCFNAQIWSIIFIRCFEGFLRERRTSGRFFLLRLRSWTQLRWSLGTGLLVKLSNTAQPGSSKVGGTGCSWCVWTCCKGPGLPASACAKSHQSRVAAGERTARHQLHVLCLLRGAPCGGA